MWFLVLSLSLLPYQLADLGLPVGEEPLSLKSAIRKPLSPIAWDPLARQEVEPDTLYLLDVEAEQQLRPGDGGLIPGDPSRDAPWTKVVPVRGKYRTGLKCLDRTYGFVWMPALGLISPDEFTVEFWLQCDRPWAEVEDNSPFFIWDQRGSVDLRLFIHRGKMRWTYRHLQDPAGPVSAQFSYDLIQHPLPAQTWVSMALTFKDGALRLYIDGQKVGEQTGLRPPRIWSDSGSSDGLSLLGGSGRGASDFALSDLRISRCARVPGERAVLPSVDTLTVYPDRPTGRTVRQTLLGGLHTLAGPETEQMARGTLRVLRTDKMLVVTPIKVGEPDAEHPAIGVSGKYSYDWQVVDRTFDYYKRLGVTPYISIDATPQILGGSVAPFSGEKLLTARSYRSSFPRAVPSDLEAFGQVVRDLVHHTVREKGYAVPYWGVWNEPNSTLFWNNKLEDYLRLYEVCARAVKSVSPALRVGGPEVANWDQTWVEGLIRYCAQRKLPLDFISWHYYLSTVGEIPQVRAQVNSWARKYGLASPPELIVGEWCWEIRNFPKTGYEPWRSRNYFLNDWHASFAAASLIEMQNAGVVYSIYTNPVAEDGARGFEATGLMSATHPWANLNVFRLWSKLAPNLVRSEYVGRPGVFAQASRDERGRLTVLLTHLRYRKDVTASVSLRVPGMPLGARITHYVVDDQHSNRYDAGDAHTELETVVAPQLMRLAPSRMAETLQVTLRPRSVHLLVFDPQPN